MRIPQKTQYILLCEDTQTELCVRHFMSAFSNNLHLLRVEKAPPGDGSGAQFVAERYPTEVKQLRAKRHIINRILVVALDADVKTIADRETELTQKLARDNQEARQPNEPIIHLFPRRNIETWIHFLKGNKVDEETVYQKLSKKIDCKDPAKQLAEHCKADTLPENAPESLLAACEEFNQRMLADA